MTSIKVYTLNFKFHKNFYTNLKGMLTDLILIFVRQLRVL